jgi:multidrug efflux system membrane fusion protein
MKKFLFPVISAVIVIGVIILLFVIGHKRETGSRADVLSDIPVNVFKCKKQLLSNTVSMVGIINPNNDVDIISEAQGVVKALRFKVGDNVKKGTILVEIDDLIKKSDMARSEINYFKSKRDFDRNKTLYEQNSISAAQLDDTKVKATIAGTINSRKVNEGSYVQMNANLGNIVDISTLKVKVNVSEKDAFMLEPGDSVEVTTDVYPGVKFYGRVDNIASKADDDHTFPVEIKLANSSLNPLKGGMFARVNFISITSRNAIVIPRESLIGSVKNAQVFVILGNIAKLKSIIIGRESGQFLEVLNGLIEGDLVVTSGQNNLSDNVKVLIVK